MQPLSKTHFKAALSGGVLAGALDIAAACVLYRIGPDRVFQAVAAGAIGREAALDGGAATVVLGAALHFFISVAAALEFVIACWMVPRVSRWPLVSGPLFGVIVYAFMNLVVVPLSAARPSPFSWQLLLVHMLLFGLPIALVAHRMLGRERPESA